MLKRIFPLLLIIMTFLYLFKGGGHKQVEQQTFAAIASPVRAVAVKTGTIQEELSFPVDVKSYGEVKIIPTYLGRIEKLYVREGDFVRKGEVLLKYVGPAEGEEGFFADLIVRAPISGVISTIYKDAGTSAEKDNALLNIAPLETVRIIVNLPSEYYTFVKPGIKSKFSIDAYPGKEFYAILKIVRPQVESASRTVYLEYRMDNPDHKLLPGMAGTVYLKNSATASGFIVPLESLVIKDDLAYVFVASNGKALLRNVKVVQEGIDSVLVSGRLYRGEMVLTTKPDNLKDGDQVTVVK